MPPHKRYEHCCVPKCKSLRQDVIFHKFPLAQDSRRKWMKCIFGDIEKRFVGYKFVCRNHFEKRFLLSTNRLKHDAYPSLFTDFEISSGKPTKETETQQRLTPTMDHSYSRKRHIDHSYSKSSDQGPLKGSRIENFENDEAAGGDDAPANQNASILVRSNDPSAYGITLTNHVATPNHAAPSNKHALDHDIAVNEDYAATNDGIEFVACMEDDCTMDDSTSVDFEDSKPNLGEDSFIDDDNNVYGGGTETIAAEKVVEIPFELTPQVATSWQEVAEKGLAPKTRGHLIREYSLPENCEFLVPPELNKEVEDVLPTTLKENDYALKHRQCLTSTAVAALAKATQMLLNNQPYSLILQVIYDAGCLLCDSNFKDTNDRRNVIIEASDENLKVALKETLPKNYLFGHNVLQKLIKHNNKVHKAAKSKKKLRDENSDAPVERKKLKETNESTKEEHCQNVGMKSVDSDESSDQSEDLVHTEYSHNEPLLLDDKIYSESVSTPTKHTCKSSLLRDSLVNFHPEDCTCDDHISNPTHEMQRSIWNTDSLPADINDEELDDAVRNSNLDQQNQCKNVRL